MINNVKDKLFLLGVAVVSVLVGMGLMLAIDNFKNQEELDAVEGNFSGIMAKNSSQSARELDTTGWKTYTNSQYGFSFKYAHDMRYVLSDNANAPYGILETISLSNGRSYVEIYVTSDSAIQQGVKNCSGKNDCYPYKLPSGCKYPCVKFDNPYNELQKDAYFRNYDGSVYVQFHDSFTTIGSLVPATLKVDDTSFENLVNQNLSSNSEEGNIGFQADLQGDLENLKIFNRILSTFKFIK